MNKVFNRLIRYLLGPAAVDGITDDMLNGLELAIQEEAARLGVSGPTATVSITRSWDAHGAGARAVSKHQDALRRLGDGRG